MFSDLVADSVVCYQKSKFALRTKCRCEREGTAGGGNLSEPGFDSGCWAWSHYLGSLPAASDLCETLVLFDPGRAAPQPATHCFSRTQISPAEEWSESSIQTPPSAAAVQITKFLLFQ